MIYELKKKVIVGDCQNINNEIDIKMTFNEPLPVSNPYSDGILPTGYFYPITAIFFSYCFVCFETLSGWDSAYEYHQLKTEEHRIGLSFYLTARKKVLNKFKNRLFPRKNLETELEQQLQTELEPELEPELEGKQNLNTESFH